MTTANKLQLVWFKRDLRVYDHKPLREAIARGPVICLYVYEPEVIEAEDFDACHLNFINDSLRELRDNLRSIGGELILRVGEMLHVLNELKQDHDFDTIWSHEETGNRITFHRDKRVTKWCREAGVKFHEIPQNGVVRRLKDRDGWAGQWQNTMSYVSLSSPKAIQTISNIEPGSIQTAINFDLTQSTKSDAQIGGESYMLKKR